MRVFLDEPRHDRHWRHGLGIATSAMFVLLGLALFIGGLLAIVRDGNPAGAIGLFFGSILTVAFGWALRVFVSRWRAPVVQVRIDEEGVRVGERTLPWSRVREIECWHAGPGRSVWVCFLPRTRNEKPLRVPGPPLSGATWSHLADELAAHFESRRLDVQIG